MATDKSGLTGNTTLLILKLLEDQDMYGYQMIETLSRRSNEMFNLKAGTLYPILHGLENEGMVESYEDRIEGERMRKYYHITDKGRKRLIDKNAEWKEYVSAVNQVLNGGLSYASV
ncbi:PadR family transcriptional regulator [Fusibacter ferrireducens]|uniref:Helix-turn-helix transcriptional regulator n=1 Tax=Fusibacter ferrireducens TaxID=2785058 RepID=A0ABR9ZZA4_9FIRM|nr:helix-turn-helix transcriptional regulator [Fusibacter ferrireducens]MBF4695782.1 helix-turn-helix transcriptional regulator [Fusibacter ferrireducens]